ncbi:MAG: ABC transporter ATP-binding protein [Nitrospirota bacterium]|nr:ABC transporter ATP-binding protein [Nitrospirota bacterium]
MASSTDTSSSSTPTPMLELENITCGYQPNAPTVHNLSLKLQPGNILCLLGPSGCGKTTTLRAIAGFEKLAAGEIRLQGQVLASVSFHLPPEQRRVGMVFQEYALFPHLSVEDNVAFGLYHWQAADRDARVQSLLELVGLKGLEHRFPHELSGGQQQRVALARALAPKPLMLLLDEPFSNLDPDMTIKMRKELYRVLRQTRTTAILVTHDHEEAFAMADQVAVMQEGVLVQCDTPESIYQQPSCAFVAEFIGQANTVPGIINNGVVETEIGAFPHQSNFHSGSRVLVMIRPNEIQFTPAERGSGHIESRQFQGSQTLYGIRLASDHLIHCCMSPIPVYNIDTVVKLQVTISQTVLFQQPALS